MQEEDINPDDGTGRIRFVACPLCGWSHKLYKTGGYVTLKGDRAGERKGWFRFDRRKGSLEFVPFIDVRDASGGRGRGLKRLAEECLTLKEAMRKEEYKSLIETLKNQISEIEKTVKSQ